jgi:hypothetical protein
MCQNTQDASRAEGETPNKRDNNINITSRGSEDYLLMNQNNTNEASSSLLPSQSFQPSAAAATTTTTPLTIKPSTWLEKIFYSSLWLLATYVSKLFATWLSTHQSSAAAKTFIIAAYNYDQDTTYFDNTILTYGTDILLGFLMTFASYQCYSTHCSLGYKGCALFGFYAISVFCGGYAHATFLDVDSMNTTFFRFCWILCVGTVTFAGGFMGMCGSEINSYFHYCDHHYHHSRSSSDGSSENLDVPVNKRFDCFNLGYVHLRHELWFFYGFYMTIICIMGEISHTRPACDIFVAGTTQFIPTMYCELMMVFRKWNDAIPGLEESTITSADSTTNIKRNTRILFYVGFMLNAPLLPSYPLLVQYTNLSLGVVNVLLHTNLTLAWGMQAYSIYHISLAINDMKESKERESLSGSVKNGENRLMVEQKKTL